MRIRRAAPRHGERLNVFVFTPGLTETWAAREDGAVYPVCPGVAGGRFDPARHELLYVDVDEVAGATARFIERVRSVNPTVRVLLTVMAAAAWRPKPPQRRRMPSAWPPP